MPTDIVEELTHTEEPAVEPEVGFTAFNDPGSSTSIATSALRFVLRTGGSTSTAAAAGGLLELHVTQTW